MVSRFICRANTIAVLQSTNSHNSLKRCSNEKIHTARSIVAAPTHTGRDTAGGTPTAPAHAGIIPAGSIAIAPAHAGIIIHGLLIPTIEGKKRREELQDRLTDDIRGGERVR